VMAVLLFLLATRDRAMWQWLTFAAGLLSAIVLLLYMPFTYSGGGGPVGNDGQRFAGERAAGTD